MSPAGAAAPTSPFLSTDPNAALVAPPVPVTTSGASPSPFLSTDPKAAVVETPAAALEDPAMGRYFSNLGGYLHQFVEGGPTPAETLLTTAHQAVSDARQGDWGGALVKGAESFVPSPLLGPIQQTAAAAVDQAHRAASDFQQGRWLEGAGHAGAALLAPLGVGPGAAKAGEQIGQGNIAGGLGTATGVLLTAVGPAELGAHWDAIKNAAGADQPPAVHPVQADALMKAVPPSTTAPYTLADLKRAQPYLAAEHLSSRIDSPQALVDAADSGITQIEEQIHQAIAAHPGDLIQRDVLGAVKRQLGASVRGSALQAGLKELDDLGLDRPVTVQQADAIRLQLNHENRAVLARNNYKVADARAADPAFAAREIAADELRTGIYEQLTRRGAAGAQAMRQDEGSLMRIRNAAQRQVFAGDRAVAGTGTTSLLRRGVARSLPVVGGGVGAVVGGPIGAGIGTMLGEHLEGQMAPTNLTRGELIAKAFTKVGEPLAAQRGVLAVPPDVTPRGLLGAGAPLQGEVVPPPEGPQPGEPGGPAYNAEAITPTPRGLLRAPVPRGLLRQATIIPPLPEDESGGTLLNARGIVVRDPATGRFKRVYLGEAAQWPHK